MIKSNYSVSQRSSYTLFILPKSVDVKEFLKFNYPSKITEANYIVVKTRYNRLCFIYKSINDINNKINPTLYIVNRCTSFTGKVLFEDYGEKEILEFKNGELIKTELLSTSIINIKDVQKIFIDKSKTKRRDIIYISNPKNRIRNLLILLLSFIMGALIFYKISSHFIQVNLQEKQIMEDQLKRQQEELKQKQELNKKLEDLKQEYTSLMNNQYPDVYETISVIIRNLEKETKIENLSIEKNTFEVDMYTKNALKVLNNFEADPYISNIKMNRSVIEGNREYTVYSGTSSKIYEYYDKDKTLQEQIDFYTNKINDYNKDNHVLLSRYIQDIRDLLSKTDCKELYLSIKTDNEYLIVELSVQADKTNLFNYLKMNMEIEPKKIIKTARIKTKTNQKLEAVLLFNTRIKKESLNRETNSNFMAIQSLLPKDLAEKFGTEKRIQSSTSNIQSYNSVSLNRAQASSNTEVKSNKQTVQKRQTVTSLIYVGKGGITDADKYIFVKENRETQVFKLRFNSVDDKSGNYYFTDENGKLKAFYKGYYVEVINVK